MVREIQLRSALAALTLINVIKKREIYQALETATDKCEDAANVIESIIIKYS